MYLIKNRISEYEFFKAVYEWLIEGDYTPDDILENIISQFNVFYAPLYHYENDCRGFGTVSLGYTALVTHRIKDSNGRTHKNIQAITDWKPHVQPIKEIISTSIYAGDGLNQNIISFVESMKWELNELNEVTPNNSDYYALSCIFKFNKDYIWNTKGQNKAFEAIQQRTAEVLPSQQFSNLRLNVELKEMTSYSVLAPYWILNYTYEEKEYYVVIDGNSFKSKRVSGTKPVDEKKKLEVFEIMMDGWGMGLVMIVITLYALYDKLSGDILFFADIAVLLFGLISTGIYVEKKVKKLKHKSLNKRMKSLVSNLTKTRDIGDESVNEFAGI